VSTATTVGTIAHISPGALTSQVRVICDSLDTSALKAELLSGNLEARVDCPLPVAETPGKRTRTRGKDPSPAQRVILKQRQKRLSGR
jgi:hypothetical protein